MKPNRALYLRGLTGARCRLTGGREIITIDGLFTKKQIARSYEVLSQLPYSLNDYDGEATAYARHWKAEFPPEHVAGMALFQEVQDVVHRVYRAYQCELKRVHCNCHLYGDLQFPHFDVKAGEGVTALYFANARWERDWMGETIFYDAHGEAEHAVAPRPGRVLLFDARILHRGGVPTRNCFEPRLSLAFKYGLRR